MTPFDFTVGETTENVGDNNKILSVKEEVNNQESQINEVVQAQISEGLVLVPMSPGQMGN